MSTNCPTCGPTVTEQHPRLGVLRCANCKEWLSTNNSTPGTCAAEEHGCIVEDEDTGRLLTCRKCADAASTPASKGLTEAERETLLSVERDEDAVAVVAQIKADAEAKARAEAWEEAAEVADTQIVLWSEVPGLHPTEPEPHPAAIAASGARRTLAVLRSRMSEAFEDRAAHIARDGGR